MSESNWKVAKQYEHYSLLHNVCFKIGYGRFKSFDEYENCVKIANRSFENLEKGAKEKEGEWSEYVAKNGGGSAEAASDE